ncbi:RNA helicase [Roseibium aquae]|uniref:DEAD-box ATP-dependent RNA helicase RhpA n=1 Tax=Roseibium aquae TaxID=1323746 RepID=A0A916X2F7_9HYPH|nr:DEAD/DEAH box helicase [Roseibium aquae]GGB54382.1 RNA helicase [Roseibium aquae]
MSFNTLGLSEKVLSAVEAAGYTTPTAIQAGAIPHVLERRDILGIAQTGTGKTASFTLPMLTLLEKGRARARMPRTLILEPTRELAAQVEENFEKYGVNHKLNVALLIGGVSFGDQDKKLDRGTDVLIATPGRLLDHFERGKLLLQGVEVLVIDEADRMLDMGFIPDIERICKLIPFTRQTLFFSATMPPEIKRLTEAFLQNPVRIEVAPTSSTAENVTQLLASTGGKDFDKRATLRELLEGSEDLQNAIVFCNRKRDIGTLFRSLERHGYSVGSLHGDMDQRTRMTTLDNFRKGTITLLVASDVAARGLDIPEVSHVFNYDVPSHAEDYVHRIGRTGRAGRKGTAFTLVTTSDQKYLDAIESLINKKIDWIGEPIDFEAAAEERKARKRGKGPKSEETAPAPEKPRAPRSPKPKAEDRTPVDPGPVAEQDFRPPTRRDREPKRANREQRSDNQPAFSPGTHIPAFLLREARPRKAS